MSAEEDVVRLVLVPEDQSHTADSVLIDASCGHRAWISNNARAQVEEMDGYTVETVCVPCLIANEEALRGFVEQLEALGGFTALPGTREDLNKELGVAETDQAWTRLGARELTPEQLKEELGE